MNTPFERYASEAALALQAVTRAMQLCARVRAEIGASALTKADDSPVTVADFASQAVVSRILSEAFPEDVLVAEEGSQALRQAGREKTLESVTQYAAQVYPGAKPDAVCDWIDRGLAQPTERFWALDPIDGTQGFLRGDQYVVALALVEAGQVVVGALGCPRLDEAMRPVEAGGGSCVVAVRGEGTWAASAGEASFTRLRVSDCSDPARARVLQSFEASHTDIGGIDRVRAILGTTKAPVRMDSQAKFAVLAAGGGDLMFRLLSPQRPDYQEKIWDQAAGSLVVTEAGGVVSDLRGAPLDFTAGRELRRNAGVLASNGRLHAAARQALRASGAMLEAG